MDTSILTKKKGKENHGWYLAISMKLFIQVKNEGDAADQIRNYLHFKTPYPVVSYVI